MASTHNNSSRLNAEVLLLKYLSNFWKSLDLSLSNCEKELKLTWSKYCVISETSRTPEVGGVNLADTTLTTVATFEVNNPNLHLPVANLSNKHIIFWNKYWYKKTALSKITNLDYRINPTFGNINRLTFCSKMVMMILNKFFWWA